MIRYTRGLPTKQWSTSSSRVIYYKIYSKDSVDGVFDGFNSTVFAYGQTGSGKTYTMFGPSWEESVIFNKKNASLARKSLMDN